ncbi:UNVERIFIED_CONTAM: hypothetical protein HHA_214910 [Hammondia hammondi]|eukprot:XP_008886704.1 hypothetical protein HHA_214910 [Hammondia hammondi]
MRGACRRKAFYGPLAPSASSFSSSLFPSFSACSFSPVLLRSSASFSGLLSPVSSHRSLTERFSLSSLSVSRRSSSLLYPDSLPSALTPSSPASLPRSSPVRSSPGVSFQPAAATSSSRFLSPHSSSSRFLSSRASLSSRVRTPESFRDLLSRLEAEEARETEQERTTSPPAGRPPASGQVPPRSSPDSSFEAPGSSDSAAPLTQRELLSKLRQSFSAYYDRHFFYPGCYPSSSLHPAPLSSFVWPSSSAPSSSPSFPSSSESSPCSRASGSSLDEPPGGCSAASRPFSFAEACASVSIALGLLGFQVLLAAASVWASEILPASSKNEEEAREAAETFVRFRLFFSSAANQLSFFSLFSSDRLGAVGLPSASPPVSLSSLCGDVWRLVAPALFPSDVTPAASVVKATCLLLSTALLQRAVGAKATLAGLGLSAATSSCVSLLAYRSFGDGSLHVSGTNGPLFFTSALLLALPGLRSVPVSAEPGAAAVDPKGLGVSTPHGGGAARRDAGDGKGKRPVGRDKKILSVLPRVPIAATALAVPVFFELALKAPAALSSVLLHSATDGGDRQGTKGEEKTEKRSESGTEPHREDETSTASGAEKNHNGASGEGQRVAGPNETQETRRRRDEATKETLTASPPDTETPVADGALQSNPLCPNSLSPSGSSMPSQLSTGDLQKKVLFEAALASGVSAALERQKERGETVSRDLRRTRIEAEAAAEEWERQWTALEIRDLRVLGDLFVFLLTLFGVRCGRAFSR